MKNTLKLLSVACLALFFLSCQKDHAGTNDGSNVIKYDTTATNFFNSTQITDTTMKRAINDLVVQLKKDSLWNKFLAIYLSLNHQTAGIRHSSLQISNFHQIAKILDDSDANHCFLRQSTLLRYRRHKNRIYIAILLQGILVDAVDQYWKGVASTATHIETDFHSLATMLSTPNAD